jgi:protein SCO1/2
MRDLNTKILTVFLAVVLVGAAGTSVSAQKNEHYNSPLYSPRKYDPNIETANGIPDALKRVGIEQRLGERLPLDAEFRDENGRIVRLGDYFSSGRPVILALVYFE